MREKHPPFFRLTFLLLFFILLIYSLIQTRDLLYPISLAILIAYLLYPIAKFLEIRGIPRIFANLICIISSIIVLWAGFYFLSKQFGVFIDDLPTLKEQAFSNIETVNEGIKEKTGFNPNLNKAFLKERLAELFETGNTFLKTIFSETAGTIAKFALLPVYVFFLLYYRNKFLAFVLKLISNEKHKKTLKIIYDVSLVTKRYMGGIFIVVLILCFLNSFGLLIIGVEYAILLGVISAILNFIPYFGTLIGGAVPLLFVLIMGKNPADAVGVIILFLIIQFLENNILTPSITGGNVKLNPFITILSIIIGGMIWGIPGMFIAVPFLGMFKIVCEHVNRLKPYSFLLGTEGTEQHAFSFEKVRNLFKKRAK